MRSTNKELSNDPIGAAPDDEQFANFLNSLLAQGGADGDDPFDFSGCGDLLSTPATTEDEANVTVTVSTGMARVLVDAVLLASGPNESKLNPDHRASITKYLKTVRSDIAGLLDKHSVEPSEFQALWTALQASPAAAEQIEASTAAIA